MESSTDNLAGDCTVTYSGVTPAYACASNKKKITVNLNDKSVAANGSFEMIIFAAPTDLKNLTIRFNVSTPNSTNPARTNALQLKYANSTESGHTGETVVFAGTKMHVLKGLVTPRSTKIIEVNSQVVDWNNVNGTTSDDVQPIDVIPQ
jgi:hypothetical protein